MTSIKPTFTRYLYERHQVEYSLQCALLAKCREEALYWAYELYHSGFQDDVWHWVRNVYVEFYEEYNPKLKAMLDKYYMEWKETNNPLLIGTVVGTLAIKKSRPEHSDVDKKFIVLYREDRHQTQEVQGKARNYLQQVTQFPIRKEAKDLAKYVLGIMPEIVREAYLGMDWLYYCAGTPIWASRIQEGKGIVDDLEKRVAFKSDDDLEAFYERWGFEPDEQCAEMHRLHGVDF
jgi:hypothetical protein